MSAAVTALVCFLSNSKTNGDRSSEDNIPKKEHREASSSAPLPPPLPHSREGGGVVGVRKEQEEVQRKM